MRIKRVFLDLDGVLVDFVSSAMRLHNQSEHVIANYPKGEWDMAKVMGIEDIDFWSLINVAGEDWWANLPAYEWARDLYYLVSSIAPVTIATSPARHHSSSAGKVRWMQSFFGPRFRSYMLGPEKNVFAQPGHLLIDDNDESIEAFRANCGSAILFPQPWNSGIETNRLETIRAELLALGGC